MTSVSATLYRYSAQAALQKIQKQIFCRTCNLSWLNKTNGVPVSFCILTSSCILTTSRWNRLSWTSRNRLLMTLFIMLHLRRIHQCLLRTPCHHPNHPGEAHMTLHFTVPSSREVLIHKPRHLFTPAHLPFRFSRSHPHQPFHTPTVATLVKRIAIIMYPHPSHV